jgi:hypothetical protein
VFIPDVGKGTQIIRLFSTDAPQLPVRGAVVETVLCMWTSLFYYLFELSFSAKWALQRSL